MPHASSLRGWAAAAFPSLLAPLRRELGLENIVIFTVGKGKGRTNQEGSSGQKPLPQPGQEMKVRGVRAAQPRLRVSPALRGPGGERWGVGWGGPCCWWWSGYRGGSERVWALHVLYGSRAKGSVSSQGAGVCLPPGVCQSGGLGSCWPRSPPSESPKCLEVGGGCRLGRVGWGPDWAAGSWPALPAHPALRTCPLLAGLPPGPCLPEAPQCWGWGHPGEALAACLPLPQRVPLLLAPGD